MALHLYYHPFSSYCQKAVIAFHENGIEFEAHILQGPGSPAMQELTRRWPMKKFPLLVDGDRTVVEATCIIEYLGLAHPGPLRLIPQDATDALETRFMDRFFDNYVSTPLQKVVGDALRPETERDPRGVAEARAMLDTAYAWLDKVMADRAWAAGKSFSMADCAAAPALFYADWTHRIDAAFQHLRAYRKRLLQRPSFVRVIDDARPFRDLFPLGAPDRD
jgi:glutathione S-transferase